MTAAKEIKVLQDALPKANVWIAKVLKAEIARLERRLNGTGKNRKAKTALVGVGDFVYSYHCPYVSRWDNVAKMQPATISALTVGEVNRVGKVTLADGWRGPIDISRSYYSTRAAAIKAMVKEAAVKAKNAREKSGDAQRCLKSARAVTAKNSVKAQVKANG
jgi:hypothetical protein